MATRVESSVSKYTYDDVLVKPKRKGKADLVINHKSAGRMAKIVNKQFKRYGDGIISYRPYDEDDYCSFKIQKIKSRSDRMIIKGKKGSCGNLPLAFGPTDISYAWGDISYDEAVKRAEAYDDLFTTVDI